MSTTTDLAERLPALLDELARSMPIAHDGDAFVPHETAHMGGVDAGPRRMVVGVAAAGLLFVGAGAIVWAMATRDASSGDPQPAVATQPPTAVDGTRPPQVDTPTEPETDNGLARIDPTLFPVVDEPPIGLEVTARSEAVPAGTLWAEAVLGLQTGTGASDTVNVTVQAEPFGIGATADRSPTTSNVFGQPATVYDYTTVGEKQRFLVTWGSGPYYLATGTDPLTFLRQASQDFVTATFSADGVPEMTFGALPDGYEVIAEPNVVGIPSSTATLSVGADNYDIIVGTRNLLVVMSEVADVRRVDIAGRAGWLIDGSAPTIPHGIAWQVDDSTYAYLKINDGTDADGALDLARRVTFVDSDTWRARYLTDVQDEATAPTAADADQPDPATTPSNEVLNEPAILAEGPVTQFESLTTGQTLTIAIGDGYSILARYEPATTAPYCVDLELDGFSGPACVDQNSVFDGRTSFALPSGDNTHQLVGQIVTDLVDSVVTSDGRTIEPLMNVWWDVTPIGSPITYTVQTSDGRATEPFPISAE